MLLFGDKEMADTKAPHCEALRSGSMILLSASTMLWAAGLLQANHGGLCVDVWETAECELDQPEWYNNCGLICGNPNEFCGSNGHTSVDACEPWITWCGGGSGTAIWKTTAYCS